MTRAVDLPARARVLACASPAFSMRAPDLRRAELIPDATLRGMEWAWNTPRFPERSVGVFMLNDVYVAEEGLVFDAQGQLYRETVTQHSEAEIERGHAAVMGAIAARLPARSGAFVLCKKRGAQNYGHWLMEMLPKAHFVRQHDPVEGVRYIVPAVERQLGQVVTDSLALLGIDEGLVERVGGAPIHVDWLLVVDGLTHHGVFMSPLVLACTDAVSAPVKGAGLQKLFVTRAGQPSRRFVNEGEIEHRALARGYTVIDPTVLSFTEQIAAFKDATDIVGVMGAAMTNIAFAPPGATILTLAPASMADTFFWFIAGLKQQNYRELRCRQIGPIKGSAPWDTDLALGPGDLDEIFPLA